MDPALVPTLDEQVVALLQATPSAFTTTRAALAAADPQNRAAILSIRKPSVGAWAIDLLARDAAAELAQAVELGRALRDAQEDLDAASLSELTRQRRGLAAALSRQAASLAEAAGVKVSAAAAREIEKTLNAAMTDAAAAAAVVSGRLVRTIEAVGFDPVELTGAVAGTPVEAAAEGPSDELAERRAQRAAEQATRAAERARAEAERELEAAQEAVDEARRRAALLEERVEALELELTRVGREAEAAAEAVSAAEIRREKAIAALRSRR